MAMMVVIVRQDLTFLDVFYAKIISFEGKKERKRERKKKKHERRAEIKENKLGQRDFNGKLICHTFLFVIYLVHQIKGSPKVE